VEAPSGVSDPLTQALRALETSRSGQTPQLGHPETTVLMDTTTGPDGSIPAGSSIPKDSMKTRSSRGSAKKMARKAKAERELQSASHTELTLNVKVPQRGGSLVGSNNCGGGTGDKDGIAPLNLKRRRYETVTPPEIRKQIKKNRGAQPLSFREAVLADRSLAIVPVGYPERTLGLEEAHKRDRDFAWTNYIQAFRAGIEGLHLCQQKTAGNQTGSPLHQGLSRSSSQDKSWRQ
ncbi:hypothetical protein PV328_011742, partial [Microctonus aethiopoides]